VLTPWRLLEDPTRSTGLGGAERFDVVALGDDLESAAWVVERMHEMLVLLNDLALVDPRGPVVGHEREKPAEGDGVDGRVRWQDLAVQPAEHESADGFGVLVGDGAVVEELDGVGALQVVDVVPGEWGGWVFTLARMGVPFWVVRRDASLRRPNRRRGRPGALVLSVGWVLADSE
jgi:hypothetical protein